MITQLRAVTPTIFFGLGFTERTISLGETVTVWIATIYNTEEYKVTIDGASMMKITDFEYQFTPGAIGTYEISLFMEAENFGIETEPSNTITLTVE